MRLNTIFCRKTGITFQYTTKYPEGNYDTMREHPQLDSLHLIIAKHKWKTDKEFLAGAILLNLHHAKLLAHTDKYPAKLMAQMNLSLQKSDSHSLYQLYNTVATYCYNTVVRGKRTRTINLTSVASGQWSILVAIQSLLGLTEEEISDCPIVSATKIAKAMMKKKEQELLTLQKQKHNKPKAMGMSLKEVMRRVKALINRAKKDNPEAFSAWSEDFGWSYRDVCYKLSNYTDLKMETRELLSLYLTKVMKLIELSDIEARSVAKIKELLKEEAIKPIELTDGEDDSWLEEGVF